MNTKSETQVEYNVANSNYADYRDEVSLKEIIIKFKEWISYLLSKWLIIFSAAIIGGCGGLIYAISKKPVYKAELTFVLEEEQSGGMGGLGSIAGQFGLDIGGASGGGAFVGDNLLALIKSRNIVQKTLLSKVNVGGIRKTLADFYIEIYSDEEPWAKKAFRNKINFKSSINPVSFSRDQNTLIKTMHSILLQRDLVVDNQDKKTSIILIQVNSPNELFSKYFTETLANNVSQFYIETKTKKSAENLAILQHQTDSVKSVYNSAISGVALSNDAILNLNPARQVLRVPAQRRQFDVQVNQAILTQLVQNLELAKVSLRKETPLIQIIDKPILPLAKIQPSKINCFLIGGILSAFILIFYFVIKRFLKML